ncbi:MAG: cation-translocating P-type ATPase [Chitinophagaceae bacterium]
MSKLINIPEHFVGLSNAEVIASRLEHGNNEQQKAVKNKWWRMLLDILKEPMLVLLIATAIIYFVMAQYGEAWFMLAAIVLVSGISFYQDNRSRKALAALEALNEPLSRVIRNGVVIQIPTYDIVVDDLVIVEEGNTINADGYIVHSNDFSVNESSLTGEAYSVFKSTDSTDKNVFSGTLVVSGLAVYKVEKTGTVTRIGKLGTSMLDIKEEPTPLQLQIKKFVKGMALIGIVFFLLVWVVNYYESRDLLNSLLKGLTLAMSVLPEEIPVAFTTFMALGSWRLMKEGIIVKKTRTVETLGSATVICSDKTGTITENKMMLQAVYAFSNQKLYAPDNWNDEAAKEVIRVSMWASEPVPFDPMEKTLHHAYETTTQPDERRQFSMVHEYPLGGKPPMMTHVFENNEGKRIIAAKGAPEAILEVCHLDETKKKDIHAILDELAAKGYRILGVASSTFNEKNFPEKQQALPFGFIGLVIFNDPPKPNIHQVFEQFYNAGIDVKIFTGDNAITTMAIARQAGIKNANTAIDGERLMMLDEQAMIQELHSNSIFTRMFPEAKLAAVNALKKDKQVVAMIGDGVNDGPALKAAHIGIAMGQKGTGIAKAAATLILVQDDLSKMVEAVASGRRIYANIKKAVQYIISIHIPIILTVAIPLFLGWVYPAIFTPVHVIFLELIMGPTCSIVYENEPMEKNAMQQPPRAMTSTFLSWREMGISIAQGLVISAGLLGMYQYTVQNGGSEEQTRTMVFSTLVFANVFLTLVNRSFYYSIFESFSSRNRLLISIITITLLLLVIMLYVKPVASFFKLVPLSFSSLSVCIITAAVSVFWFELWKWRKRKRDLT